MRRYRLLALGATLVAGLLLMAGPAAASEPVPDACDIGAPATCESSDSASSAHLAEDVTTETAETTEPDPVEPFEPASPVEPVSPVTPAEPVNPAEPVSPVEPVSPDEHAGSPRASGDPALLDVVGDTVPPNPGGAAGSLVPPHGLEVPPPCDAGAGRGCNDIIAASRGAATGPGDVLPQTPEPPVLPPDDEEQDDDGGKAGPAQQELPDTGASVASLVALAALLIAGGMTMVGVASRMGRGLRHELGGARPPASPRRSNPGRAADGAAWPLRRRRQRSPDHAWPRFVARVADAHRLVAATSLSVSGGHLTLTPDAHP